jgi:hypothetical protein
MYRVITNDVSDYIDLLVRIAHIICNHPIHTHTGWKLSLRIGTGKVLCSNPTPETDYAHRTFAMLLLNHSQIIFMI